MTEVPIGELTYPILRAHEDGQAIAATVGQVSKQAAQRFDTRSHLVGAERSHQRACRINERPLRVDYDQSRTIGT